MPTGDRCYAGVGVHCGARWSEGNVPFYIRGNCDTGWAGCLLLKYAKIMIAPFLTPRHSHQHCHPWGGLVLKGPVVPFPHLARLVARWHFFLGIGKVTRLWSHLYKTRQAKGLGVLGGRLLSPQLGL